MKHKRFQRSFSGDARLAQLAEHYLDTVGVTSSSLVPRTIRLCRSTFPFVMKIWLNDVRIRRYFG